MNENNIRSFFLTCAALQIGWYCNHHAIAADAIPASQASEFTGRVTTPSGKGAAGAEISATISIPKQEDAPHRIRTETDDQGNYRLLVPGRFVANPESQILVAIHHPHYAKYHSPEVSVQQLLGLKKIKQRLRLTPDLRHVRLKAIQQIIGKVLLPDGSPAAGAKISTSSRYRAYSWKFIDPTEYAVGYRTISDERGRFSIKADTIATMVVQHDGAAPIIFDNFTVDWDRIERPANGEPVTVKRILRLTKGVSVKGTIRDSQGQPMNRVIVILARDAPFSETEPRVGFTYSAITDQNGGYRFDHVAPDKYNLSVGDRLSKDSPAEAFPRSGSNHYVIIASLETAPNIEYEKHGESFLSQKCSITADRPVHTIDVDARKSAEVAVKIRYPDGQPSPEMNPGGGNIKGEIDGAKFYRRGRADEDGVLRITVPVGLTKSHVDVGTSIFQYDANSPLEIGNSIHLPTIEKSIGGIINLRPKLLEVEIEVESPQDDIVSNVKVKGSYARAGYVSRSPEKQDVPLFIFRSDNIFKTRVLPDEPFIISVTADGQKHRYDVVKRRFKIGRMDGKALRITLKPKKQIEE